MMDMPVYKVHKKNSYSVMSNVHFRDKNLSWKAKGILSTMFSLPEDWNYSAKGLETLSIDLETSLRSGLKELEKHGYLERKRIRDKGKIIDWEYNIYEIPLNVNTVVENSAVQNPVVENQVQLNTYILNTNKLNTNKLNTNIIEKILKKEKNDIEIIETKKKLMPPTLEEIKAYAKERNAIDLAQNFFDYFSTGNWIDGKGNKVLNWKQKFITWQKYNTGGKNEENGQNSKLGDGSKYAEFV